MHREDGKTILIWEAGGSLFSAQGPRSALGAHRDTLCSFCHQVLPSTRRAEAPVWSCPLLSLPELLKWGTAEIVPQIQLVGGFATWEIQLGFFLPPLHCEKARCWMEIPSYLLPGNVLQLPRLQNSLEGCWTSKLFSFFFLKPRRLRSKGQ